MNPPKIEELDFQVFLQKVETLEHAFNYKMNDNQILIYRKYLLPLFTEKEFDKVVDDLIKTHHRFPAIAAFLETKVKLFSLWY